MALAHRRLVALTPVLWLPRLAQSAPVPPPDVPTPSVADFDVSIMLLAFVAFVMLLLALTNHRDEDIQSYTWKLCNISTILFLAQHIHATLKDITECFLPPLEQRTVFQAVVIGGAAMTWWYLVLQVTLAWVCGAFGGRPGGIQEAVVSLKCWATLLGLVCAVTNLDLWAIIQLQVVPQSVAGTVGAVAAAAAVLWFMFAVAGRTRAFMAARGMPSEADFRHLWEKYATEQEDMVITLTAGKLIVQGIETNFTPDALQNLLLSSTVFVAAVLVMDHLPDDWGRKKEWAKRTTAYTVAFTVLNNVAVLLLSVPGIVGAILQSLLVTAIAVVALFAVDGYADRKELRTGKPSRVRELVPPLAVLVGFSWGGTFGKALGVITAESHIAPEQVETTVVAMVFMAVVVPAWRHYIMPNTMRQELVRYRTVNGYKNMGDSTEPLLNANAGAAPEIEVLRRRIVELEQRLAECERLAA